MSDWTRISGCVSLEKDPFEWEIDKDGSIKHYDKGYYEGCLKQKLPYPEEQVSISYIQSFHREQKIAGKKEKHIFDGYKMTLEITSFPVIKRKVDSFIKILPGGESEHVEYSVVKDRFIRSGSSDFSSPQAEKIFKKKSLEYVFAWGNWQEYTKYTPIELYTEDHQCNTTLTILDSIRYSRAFEFHPYLIKFFEKIVGEGIILDHGFFYYRDDYLSDDYGEEYYMKIDNDTIEVTIINHEDKTEKKEYYQVFYTAKESTEKKRYPWKNELRKVEKFGDETWIKVK